MLAPEYRAVSKTRVGRRTEFYNHFNLSPVHSVQRERHNITILLNLEGHFSCHTADPLGLFTCHTPDPLGLFTCHTANPLGLFTCHTHDPLGFFTCYTHDTYDPHDPPGLFICFIYRLPFIIHYLKESLKKKKDSNFLDYAILHRYKSGEY